MISKLSVPLFHAKLEQKFIFDEHCPRVEMQGAFRHEAGTAVTDLGTAVTMYLGNSFPVASRSTPLPMDDFEGIPALADSRLDEHDEEEDSVGESDRDVVSGGKYRFNGKHIYVTWSKSTIGSKEELHGKLLTMMPAGVRMFGGRELHQDGTPHYHVVFSFAEKVHWADAAKRFSIEGDTNAIRFEKLKPGQRLCDFLENTMAYCAKDGDTFGERLCLEGAVAEQRKRKWQDVIDEPDAVKAWKMVRDFEPRAYMVNYLALGKAMSMTKRVKTVHSERVRPKAWTSPN